MRILLIMILLSLSNLQVKKVIFIGDSLTSYKNGWQDIVSKNRNYQSTNLSKGGKKTSWMLLEISSYLSKSNNYDKVYIYGGINDAFSFINKENSFNNIQKIVDICVSKNIKPVVIIGYDPVKVIKKTGYSYDLELKCKKNYIELQKRLLSIKNATIIPIDTTLNRLDSDDGIHLNASGHRKFSKWILKHDI